MRLDGGDLLTSLPKQDTLLVEAAVHLAGSRVAPVVQWADRKFDERRAARPGLPAGRPDLVDAGYNRSLKIGVGRQHTDTEQDRLQVVAQLQVYVYGDCEAGGDSSPRAVADLSAAVRAFVDEVPTAREGAPLICQRRCPSGV